MNKLNIPDKKLRLLKLLKNGNIELRCFDHNSDLAVQKKQSICWLGIYDDYIALAAAINLAEKNKFDIYHTINPINLSATNKPLRPFQRGARDNDIQRIKTIFFDFDPIRETGTPANKKQRQLARIQAMKLRDFLIHDHGWDLCTVADSGNGTHLYFDCDLPVEYKKKYLDGLYAALEKRFSTDEVSFDVTVRNPARIARCLGTTNHKANRKSSCDFIKGFTHEEKITTLSKLITPPKITPKHFIRTGEQENKLRPNHHILSDASSAGLQITESPEGGKYWITCINQAQHGHTGLKDTVLWVQPNGFYSYHCSHDHCSNLTAKDLASFVGRVAA